MAAILAPNVLLAGTPKDMDKGFIMYEIAEVDGGGMEAMMMKGSTQTIYFDEEVSLMDMNVMNGMMRTRVYTPVDRKSGTMLMDGLLGKLKINMTEEDLSKKEEDSPTEYNIKYDKSDTRKIAGYECYRAEFQNEEGIPVMEAWITEELPIEQSPLKSLYKSLEGFPLEYQVIQDEMTITYQATEVSNKIPKGTFDIPTNGYKEMTMEEFEAMMGNMQGGE